MSGPTPPGPQRVTGPTTTTTAVTPVAATQTDANKDTVTVSLGSTTYSGSLINGRSVYTIITGTTGTFSGGGHAISLPATIELNMSGTVTVPLAIAGESVLRNLGAGTTITLLAGHVSHLNANAGTIGEFDHYLPVYSAGDNTGTISVTCDFKSGDWTGLAGVSANRWSLKNADPGKLIETAGRVLNSTGQEIGPAVGAGYVANRYYYGISPSASFSPTALQNGTVFCAPFYVAQRTTFTKVGARVTTGVGASNVQFAVYRMLNGVPTGAAIFTTASQASTASAANVEATISWTPDAGNYLLCINSNSTPSINFVVEAAALAFFGAGTSTGVETTPFFASAFGTWPSAPSLTFLGLGGLVPQIWVRP